MAPGRWPTGVIIIIVTVDSQAGIVFKEEQELEWPLHVQVLTDVAPLQPVGYLVAIPRWLMVRSAELSAFTGVSGAVNGHNTSKWETVALSTFTIYLEHLLVICVTVALLNI